MISKVYSWFLYCMGFALKPEDVPEDGEKITYMLQRQKERLGVGWWVMALGTITICLWLLLHVLGVKPFGEIRRTNG